MTGHSIDDYGHTTQTVPLTALEAAVRYAEAEVRERIARDIAAAHSHKDPHCLGDDWHNAFALCEAIARGDA